MIIAKLKNALGDVLAEVPLPESAAEISLARYVSFLNEMKYFNLEGANPVEIMARAVSELLEVDLTEVYEAEFGSEWAAEKEVVEGTRAVYGWAVRALTNYKGAARTKENFSFEYKGERHEIPFIIQAELSGLQDKLPPLTTKEAIEAFEVIRVYEQQVEKIGDPDGKKRKEINELKKEKGEADEKGDKIKTLEAEIAVDGDPKGNLLFSRYLRLIAVLAPKAGQTLPTGAAAIEAEIQSRMAHLMDIDTKTALDIDFFLVGLFSLSKRMSDVVGSLSLPLFALAATIQSSRPKKERRTIRRLNTKKKSKKGLVGVR